MVEITHSYSTAPVHTSSYISHEEKITHSYILWLGGGRVCVVNSEFVIAAYGWCYCANTGRIYIIFSCEVSAQEKEAEILSSIKGIL
jgi:hypothetical protein